MAVETDSLTKASPISSHSAAPMAEPGSNVVAIPSPLIGRVAIVTSVSRGLGFAIASQLALLGAYVLVNYAPSLARADLLALQLNASFPAPPYPPRPRAVAFNANVSNAAEVKAMFDAAEMAFGGPAHILVSCACVLDPKYPLLAATTDEDWDATFAVNARGAFLCSREAANRLVRGGGGRIINITSSVVASPKPGYAAYAASKAAVEAMTKILAKELKGTGITANCVARGPVPTDIFFACESAEAVRMAGELIPVYIAPVVGFLATDAAEWVNGQVVRADGDFA